MLFATYLFNILVLDHMYTETLFAKERTWRSSMLCFTSFGLMLWHETLSQLLLLFCSVIRLMVVVQPIDISLKDIHLVHRFLTFFYVASFFVSFALTLCTKGIFKKLPSILCLPFVDPSRSIIVINVLIWFIFITESVTLISVFLINVNLILALKKSQKKSQINMRSQVESKQTAIIAQLSMLTSTIFLYWFPANIIYVAAWYLEKYPLKLIYWTTVTIVSVNPVLIPLVFSIVWVKKLTKASHIGFQMSPNVLTTSNGWVKMSRQSWFLLSVAWERKWMSMAKHLLVPAKGTNHKMT